jgi:predicted glutamine amidotransferase
MCRLLGYCTRADASLAELMGEQSLREFTQMSEFHGDGWGVAWYGRQQPGQVHLQKSPLRAVDSSAYDELVHRRLGDLGVVHLRWATPGLPVEPRNTHPFRRGNAVMAHNGAIHPQELLGEMLPPAWERQLTGTTDSERYFLHVMSGVEAGEDMITAIEATVGHIDRMFSPNSLNAVLLTPDALYAISYYWPERIPHAALAARGLECGTDQYFELAHLETEAGIVVASSGWSQPGWTPQPNRTVLVIDRKTLRTTVTPLNPPAPPGTLSAPGPLPLRERSHAAPPAPLAVRERNHVGPPGPLRLREPCHAGPPGQPGPLAAWARSRARPSAGTGERHRVDAESRCSATVARCCSIARIPRRPCRRERASAPTIATASRIATPAANATASSASFRSCMSIM